MTRSRIGLLTLLVAMLAATFFCLPKAKVSRRVKSAFWVALFMGFFALLLGGAITEIKSKSITRWIRKTEDVAGDERSLGEAVTASRQGLINANLVDFRRNRLLGSGFQVSPDMRRLYEQRKVTLFSAMIEKGLLPLMILGESGIVGAVVFVCFLIVFYKTCARKHYTATATLFTVYLTTNLAEATFFAPSGGGGVLWMLMVLGGFAIDMQRYARMPAVLCHGNVDDVEMVEESPDGDRQDEVYDA
jgi:hypothetical protein